MARSNSYDTTNPGSAVSNYEDVQSWVSRVVPDQTPVFSGAPKGPKATATFHEWTVDKLKTPSTLSGGISEGVDVSSFSDQYEDRSKIGNYIQGFRDTWMVTKVQQRAASAGPADIANAKAKALINTKLGIEDALCSANDRQAENGAGNPYKLRGLQDWIDSAGPSDVPANYRTPAASIDTGTTLTEAELQGIVEGIFTASGMVDDVRMVADHSVRSIVSDFTRAATTGATNVFTPGYNQTQDAGLKKITRAVTYFETDFGDIVLENGNPDIMTAGLSFFLKDNFYYTADYIPMEMTTLEDQGGGSRGYCECWLTLCVKNPRALGKTNG